MPVGCVVTALILLAAAVVSVVAAWKWYGLMGLAGLAAFGFAFLLVLARFGPRISATAFRGMFRQLAGPMRDAAVDVHSVALADPPDSVDEAVRAVEQFIDESEQENERDGLHIEVSEFLGYSEVDLTQARYLIDVTIAPPESHPEAEWAPHSIALIPMGSEDRLSGALRDVELFDDASAEFRPFRPEEAFATVRGKQRLRLHASLDPSHPEYRFEYLHVNPLDATIEVPPPAWNEPPLRRFTTAILDRITRRTNVRMLSLDHLPITDEDLPRLSDLPEIEFLGLDSTEVTNAGLAHISRLTSLRELLLDHTAVTDEGLVHLAVLPNLKRLFVRGTGVTESGLERLRRANPKLKILV